DPEITLLAVQKARQSEGQPLAVFASYGLHYVGGMPGADVSADYFGAVANSLHDLTGGPRWDARPPFVAPLANGRFGAINNIDVRKRLRQPYPYHQVHAVAELVAKAIHEAWQRVEYRNWVPLLAQESTLELDVRKPTAAEVQQAKEVLERAPQGPLRTLPDVY